MLWLTDRGPRTATGPARVCPRTRPVSAGVCPPRTRPVVRLLGDRASRITGVVLSRDGGIQVS
ncbi:hypothetical protein SSP531S_39500 [Streptomyces spongiicola]|uniref:Uncharacterized protein n=1 Tax=Streptomyces spongiicola TaxID=1690221 RepID=A0A388T2X7_9ACTN|nr:hypothetical protein SSP531S_39500 [Streptomyces spongiicola]